jgi:hypothetical protein
MKPPALWLVAGLDERMPLEELERAIRVTYRVLRRLIR